MMYDESVANSERYLANQEKVHVDYLKARAFMRREHTNLKTVVGLADLPVGCATVVKYFQNGLIPRKYLEAIDDVFDGAFYAYVTETDAPVETTEPAKTAAELEEENAAQESANEDANVRAAVLSIEDETFFNAIVEEWHLLHDKITVEVNGSSFKIEKRKLEEFLGKEGERV